MWQELNKNVGEKIPYRSGMTFMYLEVEKEGPLSQALPFGLEVTRNGQCWSSAQFQALPTLPLEALAALSRTYSTTSPLPGQFL